MNIMIRNGFRHIREALQSLGRSFGRSMLSIVTVGFTLLLVGIFTSVLLNVRDMAMDATTTLEVKVFVDTAATAEDQAELEKQLNSIENVASVVFSSKDEQLEKIVEKIPSFKLFENDSNPLYDAYILKVSNSEQIANVSAAAERLNYVYRVNDGGDITDALVSFSQGMQLWGSILIVVLVLIAIVLIMNTIRTTIFSRQTEIGIMRLVGATKWFIRWPFLLEGAFIGFLGSIVPVVVVYFGYVAVYSILTPQLATSQYNLLPADPFALYIGAGLACLGILIGAFGSIISIHRFLKK